MKKTMMIAALFAASAFSAFAADVYSSNIVGYSKLTLQPGLNMIGGAFVKVATQGTLKVNEMFVGAPNAGPGEDQADFIQVWANDGSTAEYANRYYYYAEAESDPQNPPEGEFMWYDILDDSTDMSIPQVEGVWYFNRSATAQELTLVGEVATNATYTLTMKPGLNMISMPYPVAIGLNSVHFDSSNCNAGPGEDQADFIQVWDNDGSTAEYANRYFFYAEAESDPQNPPEGEFMWYDVLDDSTDMNLPVAEGFWYFNRGSSDVTITVTRPYAL